MTRDQIKELILQILSKADYDLYKSFLPECAEEPEYAEEELEKIISFAEKLVRKFEKKNLKDNPLYRPKFKK